MFLKNVRDAILRVVRIVGEIGVNHRKYFINKIDELRLFILQGLKFFDRLIKIFEVGEVLFYPL